MMNLFQRSGTQATAIAALLLSTSLLFPSRDVSAQTASVANRSKALSVIFADAWQDRLKHSPEFASSIGDKRYNDQLSDYSVQEVNASLARGRRFIERLAAIDTTGLSEQEQVSYDLMLRSLIDRAGGRQIQGMGDAGQPVLRSAYRAGADGRRTSVRHRQGL